MRRLSYGLTFLLGLLAVMSGRLTAAEPLRAIELHPDAPESLIKTLADGGINSVVIPFRCQGDLQDPQFEKSLARWGSLSQQYKLRCLPAVRLFGPADYCGAKGNYRRAVEAIAVSPCACPTDERYWVDVVTPRVRRMGELANQHGLAGCLFDYQATPCGLDFNVMLCYCEGCWNAYVKSIGGNSDVPANMNTDQRRQWIRRSPKAGEYFACLSKIVQERMAQAAASAWTVRSDLALGIYGYLDSWFYQGIARGLTRDASGPPTVMADYEGCSFSRVARLMGPYWQRENVPLAAMARLPLDDYLPRDVQNQIADLDRAQTGFLLAATDSLWRRQADVFHVYPPNGAPESFATAVRSGLAGQRTAKPVSFGRRHYSKFTPRLALLHGKGLAGMFAQVIEGLTGTLESPPTRLDAAQPEVWADSLSLFDVIIALPGAGAANPKGLLKAGPSLDRFLRNGGILIVLAAADPQQTAWLGNANLQAAGETRTGLKQGSLAADHTILAGPVLIDKLPPLLWRFQSFAPQYTSLAKDADGQAYMLMQSVGKGHVLASAGPAIPPELLANAWFLRTKQPEPFNVRLLSCPDPITFGTNALVLGIADADPDPRTADVSVDVVDTLGATATKQFAGASLAGDGLRVPVEYTASAEGIGRIVVTISDPADGTLFWRSAIPIFHEQRVEVLPDKNYYTNEAQAILRLIYRDRSLQKAPIRVTIEGQTVQSKPQEGNPAFVSVPIAGLPVGEHKVHLTFTVDAQPAYKATVEIRKESPFPTAVKILYHRNCLLEVDGRPFFPLGCYGLQPQDDAKLAPLGVNTSLHGTPSAERQIMVVAEDLRGFARDPQRTAEQVRKTLETPRYAKLLGWYMYDEPEINGDSHDEVMGVYRAGRAKDPYHPQLSVYVGSRSSGVYPDYVPAADCVMMDDYPLPYGPPAQFGTNLAKLGAAARGLRTLWSVPQCFDWREIGAAFGKYSPDSLHPTGPEALNYIYQSIVEGAGAVTFWTYRYVADDPRRHEGFLKALAEGAKLADLVTRGTVVASPEVKPLAAQIRCRCLRVGDEIHIIAVNPLERPASVEFVAPYLKGGKLRQSLPESRELSGLTDTFAPLQGKVYVVRVP